MHKIPRLLRSRHGVYYLRLTHGKTDTRRSLGTKDFQRAKLSALLLNVHVEMSKSHLDVEMFRHLDIALPNGVKLTNIQPEDKGILFDILDKLGVTGEQLAAMPTTEVAKLLAGPKPQRMEPPKPKSKPLSDVIALYLTEKKLDNVAKTLDDKERTYAEFQGFFQDSDINAFGADTAIAYKNRLLAANASASRINAKTSFLRDLFAYAIDNNLYFATNPFEKVRVSSKTKLKQQVVPYREFTDDDLKLIFDETSYRGYLRKPDYHWLPFLSLYTGARVEELACLRLDQIKKDGGIHYFEIEKAKNRNSIRKVPMHREIEASGFLAYVEDLRAKNATMLFPHLKPGKNGYSKNMSRRFGDYLDLLKVPDKRKVFHSLRHTFITRLTEMNVHPVMLMALVGHYEQAKVDFSSPHVVNYQHEKPLSVLKQTIDRLELPIKHFW